MLQINLHPDDPRGYRLQAELFLPLPREELFDFFGDAFNLEKLTPSWMNFSVLTQPPIDMHEGSADRLQAALARRADPLADRDHLLGTTLPLPR